MSVDRILKIALKDEQAKVADDLKQGDIIAVRNLRLKALSSDRQSVTGMLGGFERLIYKLNPETTGDEGCLALLRCVGISVHPFVDVSTMRMQSEEGVRKAGQGTNCPGCE